MKDFSLMTNEELDLEVAKTEYDIDWVTKQVENHGWLPPEYCKNRSEVRDLMVRELISLQPHYAFTDESEEEIKHTGEWIAKHIEKTGRSYRHKCHNPLRAAMIVYLMKVHSK